MKHRIREILGSKKEYRAQMARVAALPEDYRFVYDKMQAYMWRFCAGSGMDLLNTQYELIDLFESGATQGRHVLDVTGADVASFCDELLRGNKLWTDNIKNRLNRRINGKLDGDRR